MATVADNFAGFVGAESNLGAFTPAAITGRGLYRFLPPGQTRIPLHIRTGQQTMGNPTERKRFTQIEFHGRGSCYVRVYVDGVWIADGTINMSETPDKARRFGVPTGTRGYAIDVEFCGDADIRAVEFEYKNMDSTS